MAREIRHEPGTLFKQREIVFPPPLPHFVHVVPHLLDLVIRYGGDDVDDARNVLLEDADCELLHV